jgi:hypothetical protein
MQKNINNKLPGANCPTAWSANVLGANSMPKALTVKEKMLRTSKLYLKVEATPMDSELKAHPKTDHSKEILLVL